MIRLHNKLLKNLHREAVQKHENLKRDWGEEFYECIKDIAEHPVVLRMSSIPIMDRRTVISTASMWPFIITSGAVFFIWTLLPRRGRECSMIYFSTTGILMQRRQEIISTALPIQRRPISTPGNFFI